MMVRLENSKKVERALRRLGRRVVPSKFQKIQRQVAIAGWNQLIAGTPVDTGRHRGGWVVGIGGLPNYGPTNPDKTGQATISRGTEQILAAKLGQDIQMGNSEPAIAVLDQGLFDPPDPGPSKDKRDGRLGQVLVSGGYSTQAPEGMSLLAVQAMRLSAVRWARRVGRESQRQHGGGA